ncbi:MAG: NADH-quinone oxidoreductase subunit N [Ignavibacterium sp.]|nr:NADH-quinone oxidoreductase subunit N [Ignavibacterium sp.]MDW8375166.1 NADH-quinone oxidoreductase subunit N [Ignavibacteriales bacterium]
MNINNFLSDLNLIYPEIILVSTLVIVLLFDLIFKHNKSFLPIISLAGITFAIFFTILNFGKNEFAFGYGSNNFLLSIDDFSNFFKLLILISSIFIILFSILSNEIKICRDRHGEYYTLLLGMIIGMFFLVSANDLIVIYISIEILSLSSYILAGFVKTSLRNSEASLKYVIYGGVSSGIMIFGMSLIYGMTGSTNLSEINSILKVTALSDVTFLTSLLMVLAGLGFKISVVPFHFWTPDVYEGAPIPITAYLSVASKAAGFAVLIRFIKIMFLSGITNNEYWVLYPIIDWRSLLIIFSIITMTLGNLSALWQDNLKRMLAYSSIAHAGYILLGLAVLSNQGLTAVLIYFIIYLFMNLGAFLVVMLIANEINSEDINDYKGLGYSLPFLSAMLSIFLISLVGLPPTAGFIAKLYLFIALVDAKMIVVAIIALINTVISLYYYVRVLKNLYLSKPAENKIKIRNLSFVYSLVLIMVVPVILFGIYFAPITNLAKYSLKILGM